MRGVLAACLAPLIDSITAGRSQACILAGLLSAEAPPPPAVSALLAAAGCGPSA